MEENIVLRLREDRENLGFKRVTDREYYLLTHILAIAEEAQIAYPLSGSIAAIIEMIKQELNKGKRE